MFPVTATDGRNTVVVVETNSCPSGQKSMPLLDEEKESGGYSTLIEHAFLKSAFDQVNLNAAGLPEGSLAGTFLPNFCCY